MFRLYSDNTFYPTQSYSAHTVQLKTGKLSTLVLLATYIPKSSTLRYANQYVWCFTSWYSRARAPTNFSGSLTPSTALPRSNAHQRVQFPRRRTHRLQKLGSSPGLCSGHRTLPIQSSLAQMRPRRHLREPAQPHTRTAKAQAGRESFARMPIQDAGEFEEGRDLEG